MARLDIAERRLPQDGRIKLKISRNRSMDMRVNTLPTMWGEDRHPRCWTRRRPASARSARFRRPAEGAIPACPLQPQGMILVTGPTGSGKMVSLYTGLNILQQYQRGQHLHRRRSGRDQPARRQPGTINPRRGSPSPALRSFLRQDPDIVMVGRNPGSGNRRDCHQGRQTGHLVLSTLHTNSAAETLTRMMNMGCRPSTSPPR